jgi:pilus assembly protein CpaE
MASHTVLLLSNDSAMVGTVTTALSNNGKLTPENICRTVADLGDRLKREPAADAVVVDVDAFPERLMRAIEPLVRRFGDTRFIVASEKLRNELMLEAMQIGARYYMLKQQLPAELNDVVHRLCRQAEESRQGGAVTILSAGGGCGATTVAVNLAAELHLCAKDTENGPSLVVDLDPAYGSVASYMGADSQYGVFDLLAREGPIDAELIKSTSLSLSEQLHALLSTSLTRLGEVGTFDPERLAEAAAACKLAYGWTVLDAPRIPIAAAAALAKRSDATILLMQLAIKDLRVAHQMLVGLTERGVPTESIYIIANRYRKKATMISVEEAFKALGLSKADDLGTIPNDYQAVTEAVNLGKPLCDAAPKSEFRRALQDLAGTIASVHQNASTSTGQMAVA